MPERRGEVRHGRDPDSASDEERPLHVEVVSVTERAENVDRVAGPERAERPRAGPDRLHEERELPRRRLAEAHRAWKKASRDLEHEELAGNPGLEAAALEPQQRVGADGVGSDDANPLASCAANSL